MVVPDAKVVGLQNPHRGPAHALLAGQLQLVVDLLQKSGRRLTPSLGQLRSHTERGLEHVACRLQPSTAPLDLRQQEGHVGAPGVGPMQPAQLRQTPLHFTPQDVAAGAQELARDAVVFVAGPQPRLQRLPGDPTLPAERELRGLQARRSGDGRSLAVRQVGVACLVHPNGDGSRKQRHQRQQSQPQREHTTSLRGPHA